MTLKNTLIAGVSAASLMCGAASAEISDGVVKIGLMSDMSGTYSDVAG